jgi:glucan biosynthesis protein
MKITGRVIEISPMQSGTTQAGKDWEKQDIHVEEECQYPNSLAITFFGEKVKEIAALSVGELVTIEVNTSVKEYSGRKFNNINGWKVTMASQPAPQAVIIDEQPF